MLRIWTLTYGEYMYATFVRHVFMMIRASAENRLMMDGCKVLGPKSAHLSVYSHAHTSEVSAAMIVIGTLSFTIEMPFKASRSHDSQPATIIGCDHEIAVLPTESVCRLLITQYNYSSM